MFDSIKFPLSPPDILRICDGNAVLRNGYVKKAIHAMALILTKKIIKQFRSLIDIVINLNKGENYEKEVHIFLW